MTGMGNDGAGAMTRLRALGGWTIAEAEETAVVWGMPGELVKAGGASFVLPLSKIAEQLKELGAKTRRSLPASLTGDVKVDALAEPERLPIEE